MAERAKCILKGRVVSMDAADTVHEDGRVYVEGGRIAGVGTAQMPPPPGFEGVRPSAVGGTIYPGLIDLHNHLSYNALTLWKVPQRYVNRDDWARHPDYRRLISGPMNVLGQTDGYPEAIARYAECKALLGGVTTSQGIALFSDVGIRRYYPGLLRNVELSDGPDLPAAAARIADVVAEDALRFLARLKQSSCLLLHLSEGTDARAHAHFEALRLPDGEVAITDALAGIHCVALKRAYFKLLAAHGGAMVWSPLSNLLLYGQTADVAAAAAENVSIGLGSDWSPSGSKNLLGELKAAYAYSRAFGDPLLTKQIVAMATRNAAKIVKWHGALGSLETGKRADLIVVGGTAQKDPYLQLIRAKEADIRLVMIDGVRRYGLPSLVDGDGTESWKVGGRPRRLDLRGVGDEAFGSHLSLRETVDRLRQGLQNLPALARDLEAPRPVGARKAGARPRWFLELDHDEPAGVSIRPRFAEEPAAPQKISAMRAAAGAAVPLSQLLGPLPLDPLTSVDDAAYLDGLLAQLNLPVAFKEQLRRLYE